MLVSFCVVQSMAYPPSSELDEVLRSMLTTPLQTLARLERIDRYAAEILSIYLSGYATVRKIYDLRDQEFSVDDDEVEQLRPLARKREAMSALVTAVTSASDSIHGGLYDASVDSVVPVAVLLSLLGESLVFLNREHNPENTATYVLTPLTEPKRTLSSAQVMVLLKAVEDLSTSPAHIFDQCEECFKSTLAHAQGFEVPSPQDLLKKSMSSMTASSHFSLIDSSMLRSQSRHSSEASGVLVNQEVSRAWDWRKGLKGNSTGNDLLKILRLGLAKELAQVWTAEN